MISNDVWLAISTFPDAEIAGTIAQQLVTAQLAACANVLPGARSIYRWRGKVENASETIVLFKTTRARFAELQNRLKELHPYDVPEIVALPVVDGLPAYLAWVNESCETPSVAKID